MNNNQFRRLVFDTPGSQNDSSVTAKSSGTPSAFGAKKSSFMPMTPRTVKGGIDVDFARQVRERNAALQPAKKFKSAAPKGARFAAGYTDRARARAEAESDEDGEDNKAGRISALEEQMKLGQISVETFEALRDQITGGDIGSTHLVKGLDRKLLERVRRGEDVLGSGGAGGPSEAPPDVDEELDKLGEQNVEAVRREQVEKKGRMAPPPPVAGVKRSRDEIMAELKAQRKAAAVSKVVPTLDGRWKKVGEHQKNKIMIDKKGREVLITVDEDGIVTKKVRRARQDGQGQAEAAVEMPDISEPILGSDAVLPEPQQPKVAKGEDEDDDDDIFEGVGTVYNPLGESGEDDESDDESDLDVRKATSKPPEKLVEEVSNHQKAPEKAQPMAPVPGKYFKDTLSSTEERSEDRLAGVQDLLKKAAKMDSLRTGEGAVGDVSDGEDEDAKARESRLKKRALMLAQQDRDMDDMDMGFSGGRYDDGEDDGDGKKVKLSEWKGSGAGIDDGDLEEGGKASSGKKKRKPKKRKGDVNNAADIMRVIEGRKAKDGK